MECPSAPQTPAFAIFSLWQEEPYGLPRKPEQNTGTVYLVGAGPGDPGLFTLKGKLLLEIADVVFYDYLVSPEILRMANPSATLISVGKKKDHHSVTQPEILEMLISKAANHKVIVRLKGGDPFVFGRGGEEMEALLSAGVKVEVVPGVTSGIAAPAYAGIPVTHRSYSSSVTFVTGHEMIDKNRTAVNWPAIAQGSETVVVYMGVHNLSHVINSLRDGGLGDDTPVALVRWGTWKMQEELVSTLKDVVDEATERKFAAPAIAIIGNVVKLHSTLSTCRPTWTDFSSNQSPSLCTVDTLAESLPLLQ